ncbi:hypothetical protein AVEN_157381-1 [Araneus ventricosus]|uniref:Uncharacterized protein n=1 Tax=Araneus ventricosus TaxID=182803 RepID=A0A4Y2R076_ARAVE|nr:hypothetical protein AVEN_157381-1 [Araneus ventricosus]
MKVVDATEPSCQLSHRAPCSVYACHTNKSVQGEYGGGSQSSVVMMEPIRSGISLVDSFKIHYSKFYPTAIRYRGPLPHNNQRLHENPIIPMENPIIPIVFLRIIEPGIAANFPLDSLNSGSWCKIVFAPFLTYVALESEWLMPDPRGDHTSKLFQFETCASNMCHQEAMENTSP